MKYYYMNKENGNLLTANELFNDAEENEYEDILDPCSVEYGNWGIHYSATQYAIMEA